MPGEIELLIAAIALGVVHLVWGAIAARRQQGLDWARGARDEPRPVSGVAARLERAFANYRETFPLFAAGVLTAYLTGKTGGLALCGSVLYVAARIAYLPLYASGVKSLRSYVWFISFAGLILILIALVL